MRLLVIRFSAMGDVALTVPVIRGVLAANPELQITMVSNARFEPFFYAIERLTFQRVTLENYRGAGGMYRLYRRLAAKGPWDAVLDLHSVIRTWAIGGFFKLSGVPVFRIDKGRKEKKALVKHGHKTRKPLKHTTERYLEVFHAAGLPGKVMPGDVIRKNSRADKNLQKFFAENGLVKDKKWLGIAPFSLHREKTWPLSKVTGLIEALGKHEAYQIFLLGGQEDVDKLKNIAALYPHCRNMAGIFSLDEEIALIHHLEAVVAMDSFNMHLAALCGVKVVSVWGATHPYAGFGPLNGNDQYIVQLPPEELSCRPCSVFGSKPCYREDRACLTGISVQDVLQHL